MIIDCASCVARPTECSDCVVSVVLGPHPEGITLDSAEQTAVAVLAGSGLVPPLRMMPPVEEEQPAAPRHPPKWPRRERAG
jgi:hypothetical protein